MPVLPLEPTVLLGTLAIVCTERTPNWFVAAAFDVLADGARVEIARLLDARQGNAVERLRSSLMTDLGLPSEVVLAVHAEFLRDPAAGRHQQHSRVC